MNLLFFIIVKEKVGRGECIRVELCPIGMDTFQIVFLCELVPFNTTISYEMTNIYPVSEGGFEGVLVETTSI